MFPHSQNRAAYPFNCDTSLPTKLCSKITPLNGRTYEGSVEDGHSRAAVIPKWNKREEEDDDDEEMDEADGERGRKKTCFPSQRISLS